MIDRNWAEKFAQEWIDSWNGRDLERIFSLYADDFEMKSPMIIERMKVNSGRLRGKIAIRPYWSLGLATTPDLHFELLDIMVGIESIALVYRSVTAKRRVVELLEFGDNKLVVRAQALHGPRE